MKQELIHPDNVCFEVVVRSQDPEVIFYAVRTLKAANINHEIKTYNIADNDMDTSLVEEGAVA